MRSIILFLILSTSVYAFDNPFGANPWTGAAGAAGPTPVTFVSAEMTTDSSITLTLSDLSTYTSTFGTFSLIGSETGTDTLDYVSGNGADEIVMSPNSLTYDPTDVLTLSYTASSGDWNPAITGFTGESVLNSITSSCATDSETTVYGGSIIAVLTASSDAYGQSFEVSTTNPISAISLYGGTTTAGATVEVRWGTTSDLSTTYEASTTVTWGASDDSTWQKGTFVTKGGSVAGTTYYFAVALTSGAISLGADNTNPYADGTLFLKGTGFNVGAANASYDLGFKIYQCD